MALSYAYNMAEENADPYNVDDPDYDGRNQPLLQVEEIYKCIARFLILPSQNLAEQF